MKNHITGAFWGPKDYQTFCKGIQQCLDQISPHGIYLGDNLFVFGRSLSFLDDAAFMDAVNRHAHTIMEKAAIWRTYVLCWAARRALRFEGDFAECGCYKGTSVRIVADYVRFGDTDKHYYVYDLFEHSQDMAHEAMPEHSSQLYEQVRQRFADLPNVTVTKGRVPDSFAQAAPDKISFLHIDMNNADAELGALEHLFDRVVPGGIIIFDDYGWLAYNQQKTAEDRFFAERGFQVLELPTGQGLVLV